MPSMRVLLTFLFLVPSQLFRPSFAFPHSSPISPPSADYVKESTTLPSGWSLDTKKAVSLHEHIILRIGLVQSDPAGLEETLLRISTPSSESYGRYLSQADVLKFMLPTSKTTSAVKSWLSSHGISTSTASPHSFSISPTHDWYTVNITVSQANGLLGTTFHAYKNSDTSERIVRAMSYSLPNSLNGAIDTIQPTTIFPTASKRKNAAAAKHRGLVQTAGFEPISPSQFPNCTNAEAAVIPPWCVKKLYNVGNYTPLPPSKLKGNTIGISGYLDNYPQYSDLAQYLKLYLPTAAKAGYKFSLVSPFGSAVPQNDELPDSEANLDVQVVAGLAYPLANTFYSIPGTGSYNPDANTESNTNEPYLDLQNYLLSLPDSELPSVLTTSYGDDEQSVSYEYALRVCRGYAALGLRGVSVIFSSGDMGVGPYYGGGNEAGNECLTNDGSNRTVFIPSFPASCPWVTTVGETQNIKPEYAMSESSGGFSNYFARPAYQSAAVDGYLTKWGTKKYASYFNRTGRGFPDVAAQGNRITMFDNGKFSLAFGTSASAPIVASLVALLNDHRLRNGLPKLGFLNPLLYSEGAKTGLNDITEGTNPGCSTDGFKAMKGWDPISGLGTLNFGVLKDVVSSK